MGNTGIDHSLFPYSSHPWQLHSERTHQFMMKDMLTGTLALAQAISDFDQH